jgi:hypothetical protein
MRSSSLILATCALLLGAAPSQASRIHRGPTSKHKASKGTPHQRAIDDGRATQIQTALVKAGYLPTVSGHWDASSEAAMQKLQADNGWQTKLIPDSRALIKLGLGPNAEASAAARPVSGPSVDAFHEPEDQVGK